MTHRSRTRFLWALLPAAILAGLVLVGCDVAKPELPTFQTQLALPLGEERLDILDLIESEDYLVARPDGILGFEFQGDADTVDLDFELGADVASQTVSQDLGTFDLDLAGPDPFVFRLDDLYPAAALLDGTTMPVPAFTFDQLSPAAPVPDLTSATITAGTMIVTIDNGLSVPVSGTAPPELVSFTLIDEATGNTITVIDFDAEIPAGGSDVRAVDLAGTVLPAAVAVNLTGGSPGSGTSSVFVDAAAEISVSTQFLNLQVDAAEAVIPPQTFATSFTADLPTDYEVETADIVSGGVSVSMTNELPIPCQAVIVWPEIVDPSGALLRTVLDMPPGGRATGPMDFAGCTVLAPGGVLLTQLLATVTVTSPGSGTQTALVRSDQGVNAIMSAGRLEFSAVTGTFPTFLFALDALEEELDMPDELDGIELQRAALIIEIGNSSGLEAGADLTLVGINDAGNQIPLRVQEIVAALPDGMSQGSAGGTAGVTRIVLDETNSQVVDFLNNMPTRITLNGDLTAGGPGNPGTVHAGDRATIDWSIAAPVEIVVGSSRYHGDPSALGLDESTRDLIRDHAKDAHIRFEVHNHLPVGIEAWVLFGADLATIADDPLLAVGPVLVAAGTTDQATGRVTALTLSNPELALTETQTQLLATADLHSLVEIRLLENGGPTATVMTTDYVTLNGLIQLGVEVSDD